MNLAAAISLNTSAFLGPLQAMRRDLSGVLGTMRSFGSTITGLGAVFAAFKSGEAVLDNFFAVFNKGDGLVKLSRMTGESVKDLVVLQKAFTSAGVEAGALGPMIAMLQKSLAGVNEQGEPTKAIFEQLGLSLEALLKLPVPAQLEQIGARLRTLPSAAQRTAAAMAIFGRSGAEMLAVLNDPNALSDAMKDAASLGQLYQRNAAIFSEIDSLFKSIKGKVGGLFAGLAEGLAPSLRSLLLVIKQIDLAKIGRDLGSIFAALPAALEQGKIGELLNLTLQTGFAKAINFFSAGLTAALAGFAEMLGSVFANFGSIADVLVGAAAQFGAALLQAVQKPLAYVQATMESVFARFSPEGIKENALAREAAIKELRAHDSRFKGRSDDDLKLEAQYVGLGVNRPVLAGTGDSVLADAVAAAVKSVSIEQRAQRILTEGGPRFGFGDTPKNAAELGAAGRATMEQGLNALRAPIAELIAKLGAMAKDFKVVDVAGAGQLSAELKKLIESLVPRGTSEKTSAPRSAAVGGERLPSPQSDRFARGGFFLSAGGPANDYARRTSTATEKLVELMKDMKNKFPGTDFPQLSDPLHGVAPTWR